MALLSTKLSFNNLISEVIDTGLCVKCGACVSFCAEYKNGAIELCSSKGNLPSYTHPENCYNCGICYLLCPQTYDLNEEIKKDFGWSYPIGHYNHIYSAQATDGEIKDTGNIGRALSLYLLENKIVDCVIAPKRTGLFDSVAEIMASREEIVKPEQVATLEFSELDDQNIWHSDYTTILPFVRMLGSKNKTKLAILGTPCQIGALRKMEILNLLPAKNIVLTIGSFCMQCYTFQNLKDKSFINKLDIQPENISDFYFKEDYIVELSFGAKKHLPPEDFEDMARPSCMACQYFSNDFADISIGGAGSPDGFSTTVLRTKTGERIFYDAAQKGYIQYKKKNKSDTLQIVTHIENFIKMKQVRAEKAKVDNLCTNCDALNKHLNWVMSFVTHELKSMLGSIVINISALADDEISARLGKTKSKQMMAEALVCVKHMEDMIQNYLVSSKINMDSLKLIPTKINIGLELTSQIVKNLKPRFDMKGMSFLCEKCDQVEVVGDKSLLYIAISNLVSNSVKYGKENTSVYGSVIKYEDGFEFRIRNEGMGIPEDKLESIFDEYVRFDTLGTSGSGLGLFLVKKIAEMHHGTVKAEAGYIIDNKLIPYHMLGKASNINYDEKNVNKFALFKLYIPLVH